jgi:hypothetical protein
VLAVAASVGGIDLTLTLVVREPTEARPQDVAAVGEAAAGDESVQCGQVLIGQTNWDLMCHTISIPLTVEGYRPDPLPSW